MSNRWVHRTYGCIHSFGRFEPFSSLESHFCSLNSSMKQHRNPLLIVRRRRKRFLRHRPKWPKSFVCVVRIIGTESWLSSLPVLE